MSKYKYLFLTLAASIILGWFFSLLLLNYKQVEVADKEAHWRAQYLELVNYIGQFARDEERGLSLEQQVDRRLEIARRNLELRRYNEARTAYDDADRVLTESYERAEFSTYLRQFRIRLNKIGCMRDFGFAQYVGAYVQQARNAITSMQADCDLASLSEEEKNRRRNIVALSKLQLANELMLVDFLEVNRQKTEKVRREGFESLLTRYVALEQELDKVLLWPLTAPEERQLKSLLQDVRANKTIVEADLKGESLFFPEAS
jgi:hypothetical protein